MLNIKTEDGQTVWFSSDFHLGHQKNFIWESRGYASYESHTDGVINKINQLVKANDLLFYLGDFCLNSSDSLFESYLSRIQCQNIYMVWGNHNNPVFRIYKREVKKQFGRDDINVYPLKYRNVTFLGDYVEISLNNTMIVMMHYPISIWNYMKEGAYMLCGHSHYNYIQSQANHLNGKILDVGWDGIGEPYSFEKINEIMKTKKIKVEDHHVKNIID
jgi:calcineurin-like phosphoesterase family protein